MHIESVDDYRSRLFPWITLGVTAFLFAFGVINWIQREWFLFAADIALIAGCATGILLFFRGWRDRALSFTLLWIGITCAGMMLYATHFYETAYPVEDFFLPYVLTNITLAAVFLKSRRDVVISSAYSCAVLGAHIALSAGEGPISTLGSIASAMFAAIAVAGAFVFQHLREQLVQERDRANDQARSKQLFLSNMSHEIRTPLSGITGLAELLANAQSDRQRREYVQHLSAAVADLRSIVDDILDLQKIEAGRMTLAQTDFDPHDLMEELAALYRGIARQSGIVLETCPCDCSTSVRADARYLRQILRNLLDNAVKFTHAGSVSLGSTWLESEDDQTPWLQFEVRDTGVGIPAANQDAVFGAFVQCDSSYAKKFKGTGLGLAICRELTALLGGEIWFESQEGVGTSFYVRIPVESATRGDRAGDGKDRDARSASREVEHSSTERPAHRPRTPGIKVLLAEDDRINAMVAERFLTRLGHSVTTVADGRAAIDAALETQHDLIFMDAQMPEVDGVAAIRAIRAREDDHSRRTPILALTAYVSPEDHERLIRAGADGVITKPFTQSELADAIERFQRQSSG